MDLSTTYLGIDLPHPLMPGASPMVEDLDTVRKLEDAGSAAIVMHSLFEEQLIAEQLELHKSIDHTSDSWAEASSYFPKPTEYRLGPEEYLDQIQKIKGAVKIPVIASLNGSSLGGWLDYAKQMQQAGADALELNVYALATDPKETGSSIERTTLEMVRAVKGAVGIPVAVKLSPFYSALPNFARKLDEAGVDGMILFNRFYQPDIDIEELDVERTLHLSTSAELLLRLRWLAILSGKLKASLAASGGVHTETDAIKAVMAGAHAVQLVSSLLIKGPEHLRNLRDMMSNWLEDHEYESLRQMQGSMSLQRCPRRVAFERANYVSILTGWRA